MASPAPRDDETSSESDSDMENEDVAQVETRITALQAQVSLSHVHTSWNGDVTARGRLVPIWCSRGEYPVITSTRRSGQGS